MKYIIFIFTSFLIMACGDRSTHRRIAQKKDYNDFLKSESAATSSKYFELWNSKIKSDSMQTLSLAIVAGEYSRFFRNTGDISYLKKAEKALVKAIEFAAIDKEVYLRALARNYISQHRFKEALIQADEALALGGGRKASQALLFDVHMELGNYSKAENQLDSLANHSDFSYLIRLAKWNDHKGDLDTTIRMMKKAEMLAERSNNMELILWVYTNLADYYGHAGEIESSYEYYLKTLESDPSNAYAKKGLA